MLLKETSRIDIDRALVLIKESNVARVLYKELTGNDPEQDYLGKCPSGHPSDKNKCFQWYADGSRGYCFHCSQQFDAISLWRCKHGIPPDSNNTFAKDIAGLINEYLPEKKQYLGELDTPIDGVDSEAVSLERSCCDFAERLFNIFHDKFKKFEETEDKKDETTEYYNKYKEYLNNTRNYTTEMLLASDTSIFPNPEKLYNTFIKSDPKTETILKKMCFDVSKYSDAHVLAIPYRDLSGVIVGMIERRMPGDPAYRFNSRFWSEKKKSDLFNLYRHKRSDTIYIVEGYLDAAMIGITQPICAMGTALLSNKHIESIVSCQSVKRIVLIPDNDTAGVEAAPRNLFLLLEKTDCEIKIVPPLSWGDLKDPDEFFRKFGIDATVEKIKKEEVNAYEYLCGLDQETAMRSLAIASDRDFLIYAQQKKGYAKKLNISISDLSKTITTLKAKGKGFTQNKNVKEEVAVKDMVVPLGYNDDTFVFYSRDLGAILQYTYKNIEPNVLCSDLSWWQSYNPSALRYDDAGNVIGIKVEPMRAQLVEDCKKTGHRINETSYRESGIYFDSDSYVLHTGQSIYVNGIQTSEASLSLSQTSDYIYKSCDGVKYTEEDTQESTKEDIKNIIEALEHTALEGCDSQLLLGVYLAGLYGGISPWRTHANISSAPGTGKSTLVTYMNRIAIPVGGVRLQGTSTEAGIRQEVRNKSTIITIDEAEHLVQNSHHGESQMDKLLSLARDSSSGGSILRGTPSGNNIHFNANCTFVLYAVGSSIEEAVDEQRFIQISLGRPFTTWSVLHAKLEKAFDQRICNRIVWRAYMHAKEFIVERMKAHDKISKFLIEIVHCPTKQVSRFADLFAGPLAALSLFTTPTCYDYNKILYAMRLRGHFEKALPESSSTKDYGESLLEKILDHTISIRGINHTVRDILMSDGHGDAAIEPGLLRPYGIYIFEEKEEKWLKFKRCHALSVLLSNYGQVTPSALKSIPGARTPSEYRSISGERLKGIEIPLKNYFYQTAEEVEVKDSILAQIEDSGKLFSDGETPSTSNKYIQGFTGVYTETSPVKPAPVSSAKERIKEEGKKLEDTLDLFKDQKNVEDIKPLE